MYRYLQVCENCSGEFYPPTMGRRSPKFCSAACRQAAYRKRKALKESLDRSNAARRYLGLPELD